MSEPLEFQSRTERLGLPNLFAGQAQKEMFVNEALARLDVLLHPVVEGERASPPANPVPGESWIVSDGASGAWAGRDRMLAGFRSGSWIYAAPSEGMRVWDMTVSRIRLFRGEWLSASQVSLPDGGVTIDSEARTSILELVEALGEMGILAEN